MSKGFIREPLHNSLDYGPEKKDLMISLSGVTDENFHHLAKYLETLKASHYNYDLFVGLTSQEVARINPGINLLTINLINLCPNHLLITLSHDDNIPCLHHRIARDRGKSYLYYLVVTSLDGQGHLEDLNTLLNSQAALEKCVNILNNRPDLVLLGPKSRLSFLDNREKESLERFFRLGTAGDNLYERKREVLRDFIAEYYDRDIDETVHILEHHVRANNHFTVFQSFDLKKGHSILGEDVSIREELGDLLKPDEEMPCSTNLIEIIYQKEGVPRFINGSCYLVKHSFWQEFHHLDLPEKTSHEWLSRAMAIYASRQQCSTGGVQVGEAIRPTTIIACHFKQDQTLINLEIKRRHLEFVAKASRETIIVHSSEREVPEGEIESVLAPFRDQPSIRLIEDKENRGLDINKWLAALKGVTFQPDPFHWIWLTNDSWFSCRPLDDWFEYYSQRIDLGLIGLTNNLEGDYHLQSYSWLLNSRWIPSLIEWNQTNSRLNYQKTVRRNEIGFCNNLLSRAIRLESYYNTIRYCPYNLFTNRQRLFRSVESGRFPLVKLRFLTFRVSPEILEQYQRARKGGSFLEWAAKTFPGRQWYDLPNREGVASLFYFDHEYLKLLDRSFALPWLKSIEKESL
jgi:hypothetical protein